MANPTIWQSVKAYMSNLPILSPNNPLWSEGFRPFFLLIPIYAIVSIVLWGLVWGGVIVIPFTSQLLYWHIYEMVYGLGMAGILGFLLTAIPEFISGTARIDGHKLASLFILWLVGRVSFWLFSITGLWVNFILHIGLSTLLLGLIAKPVWTQEEKRHIGLWLCVFCLTILQALFFLSQSEVFMQWTMQSTIHKTMQILPSTLANVTPMQWLYASVSSFMILIILVFRRVGMGVSNTLLEQYDVDEKFIARPPMYNLVVFAISLFILAELFLPESKVLGWLAFAVACALLNLLNDYFKLPITVLFWHHIRHLWLIIVLMAIGYFAMGWDYLYPDMNNINHLRHILTTGVIGVTYLLVLSIVAVRHTGRDLQQAFALDVIILLVVLSILLRLLIIPYPDLAPKLYMWSALVWAMAFVVYLAKYGRYLVQPNVN